jgi:phosphatidylglycerophosphate synthase
MSFWLLTAVTTVRLVVCGPVWFWCWWKRPKRMVLWMSLVFAYFVLSDHFDGAWARTHGLTSELGYWLDHAADFVFYGIVVLTIVKGTREPGPGRRRGRRPAPGAPP